MRHPSEELANSINMNIARDGADLVSDEDRTLFVEFLVSQRRLPSTVVHFIECGDVVAECDSSNDDEPGPILATTQGRKEVSVCG